MGTKLMTVIMDITGESMACTMLTVQEQVESDTYVFSTIIYSFFGNYFPAPFYALFKLG